MSMRPALEIRGRTAIVQYFKSKGSGLAVVSILLGTFRNTMTGSLSITVSKIGKAVPWYLKWIGKLRWGRVLALVRGSAGMVVGQISLPSHLIEDNQRVDILIAKHAWFEGEFYSIKIEGDGITSGHAPTAWLADDELRIPGHLACFVGKDGQAEYGLAAQVIYGTPLVASSVPPSLLYSPVTQCNLNCIHCISRHTRTKLNRLPNSFKHYLKVLCDEGKIEYMMTDYSGDILWSDHRFGGELEYLFSLGIPFHIDTNGAYLTKETSLRLAESKLKSINISLDAATDESFRRVRKGAPPLAEVLKNIQDLIEVRRQKMSEFSVSVSFTLMVSTLHEWPDFLRMAAAIGVPHVHARHLEAYTEEMEKESMWHDKKRFNSMVGPMLDLAKSLDIGLGTPPPFNDFPVRRGHLACPEPWRSAVILGNGDVAACCVPGMVMGNLNEESLEEIWNGSKYQRLRETVNTADAPEPCQSCPMYRINENPDSYLIYSARQKIEASRRNAIGRT
jgi:radical SAM protein with 4Fe4S-binding SPASM domain